MSDGIPRQPQERRGNVVEHLRLLEQRLGQRKASEMIPVSPETFRHLVAAGLLHPDGTLTQAGQNAVADGLGEAQKS